MMNVLEQEVLKQKTQYKDMGFTIRKVGIGDGIQFTSLPENFYRLTGEKLIDLSEPWYLDHNPFVERKKEAKKIIELWNYPKQYEYPKIRNSVYLSNAEIHLSLLGLRNPPLIRPRLYRYEDFQFKQRHKILFHPFGKSHGALPEKVIDHVVKKYDVYQIGLPSDPDIGCTRGRILTPTLWDLVKVISECRMLIGVDSGPSWIAACFPDVVIKKIRVQFQKGFREPQDWIPLEFGHEHAIWDDQNLFQIYNCFETDVGFTQTYLRI